MRSVPRQVQNETAGEERAFFLSPSSPSSSASTCSSMYFYLSLFRTPTLVETLAGSTGGEGDAAGGGGVSRGLKAQTEEFQENWTRVGEGEAGPNQPPNPDPNPNPRNNVGGVSSGGGSGGGGGGGDGGYFGEGGEPGGLRGSTRPVSEVLGGDRDGGPVGREEEKGEEFQGLGGFVEDLSAGVLGGEEEKEEEEGEEALWASQYAAYSSDSAAKRVARTKQMREDLASEMWWEAVGTGGWGGVAGVLESGRDAVGRAFAKFLLRDFLEQRPGRGRVGGDVHDSFSR